MLLDCLSISAKSALPTLEESHARLPPRLHNAIASINNDIWVCSAILQRRQHLQKGFTVEPGSMASVSTRLRILKAL